jgi:hypothetical protein
MPAVQENIGARVLDHICSVVEKADVCSWPYAHFYIENVFPDAVYNEILDLLPDAEAYTPDNPRIHTREDGRVTRSILSLSAGLKRLPDSQRSFWNQIGEALTAPRFRHAVFARLSRDLSKRFHVPPEQLHSIPAFPKPALVKDLGGYEIAPHRDTRSKIVTIQFYLPKDMSKTDLGTAVYRQRLFQLKNLVSLKNRFETVKRFSFAPNTGYAFAVGPRSWHGRERMPMTSGERDSLMLIYYTTPDKGW